MRAARVADEMLAARWSTYSTNEQAVDRRTVTARGAHADARVFAPTEHSRVHDVTVLSLLGGVQLAWLAVLAYSLYWLAT
jgi:hypothetical protein